MFNSNRFAQSRAIFAPPFSVRLLATASNLHQVMTVPLLDLKAQYHALKADLDAAVLDVIERQHFILGPDVERLERMTEEYLGVRHALGVSSGTDALLLALMALGIGPGDEVIVPTFSFFATAGVVSRLYARPVFVDIDPKTWNIDPEGVAAAITERTKAIVPVHLFGQSADMDALMAVAAGRDIPVIEDAAQAIGTQYHDGRRVGGIGFAGCFSFFPSKNLGGFGDGGLLTTNDSDYYQRVRIMRMHGEKTRYHHMVVGGNFRLDALQAAVLAVKLPHLPSWSAARRKNAELYNQLFIEAGLSTGTGVQDYRNGDRVLTPAAVHGDSGHADHHIFNQYVIRSKQRDDLKSWLESKGVGTAVYYPIPFHQQECFSDLGYSIGDFPNAERAANEVLALPIYPELANEQIEYVVQSIADFFQTTHP